MTVYDYLLASGLNETLSKFAACQSAFETANFTSNIYKNNNNAFGMKYAGQSASTGEKNGYADYLSVQMSVSDFVVWYTRHRLQIMILPYIINSLSDYVDFLKNCGYFEANRDTYYNGCLHYYQKLFGNE